jgi:hypothetical protein
MTNEPLSPELALVDPDLAARARAALPQYAVAPARRPPPTAPVAAPASQTRGAERRDGSHPYPLWARVTAALWLVVLGILIGGAAIPHAQDMPRVVPPSEEPPAVCTPKGTNSGPGVAPTGPGR